MSLGIALGSFMQGFSQGAQIGQQLHEVRKQRRLESSVEGITSAGKKQFDADVAAGKAEPGDFMARYTNELVPQIANKYLEAGDPDKAQAWTDWAEASSTKKAAKLFTSGLGKFHAGDVEGALKDMQKAANTSGYGPDGKMSIAEYYDEAAGAVTGYRLGYTTPDGKEVTRNVATADLPKFFASTINPRQAFEYQIQQEAEQAKADREVDTYGRKKQLDKKLGTGTGALTDAQYQNAIQEERKRIEDSALTDPDISEMSADEKEALAKQTVDERFAGRGQPASTGPSVAVDPSTGEIVEPAAQTPTTDAAVDAAPADEQLGISAPVDNDNYAAEGDMLPGEAAPAAVAPSGPMMGSNAPADPAAAATPAAGNSQVDPGQQQQYLMQASQMIKQGGNGQQIGQALIAAGIPPEAWPQDVRLAVTAAQPGVSQ